MIRYMTLSTTTNENLDNKFNDSIYVCIKESVVIGWGGGVAGGG